MVSLLIGSLGVGLLLAAFALNLTRKLHERHPAYLLMNFVGAAMAAWYALVGDIIPFVILESVWAAAAAARLILLYKKGPQHR